MRVSSISHVRSKLFITIVMYTETLLQYFSGAQPFFLHCGCLTLWEAYRYECCAQKLRGEDKHTFLCANWEANAKRTEDWLWGSGDHHDHPQERF